jgi:hypothetical protein
LEDLKREALIGFPANQYLSVSRPPAYKLEITIFPRVKIAITTRTGAGIPPYQRKKGPPNEIPENDS